MPKVIFFTSLATDLANILIRSAPPHFDVRIYPPDLAEEQQKQLIRDTDFLILFTSHVSDDVLRSARQLKLIQLVGAGYDKINLPLCREIGVPVANNGGTNAVDAAEHALTLMLAAYRRLPEMDRNVRSGNWDAIDSGATTYTIHGKTVGIVGLGKIGQRVAQLLKPFDAELLFFDPSPPPADVQRSLGVMQASLEELLRRADIVTLHVPLLPSTRHLIGAKELAAMKPTALLVNTGRGPVVDEAALSEALRQRRLGWAALDVYTKEPVDPANPILRLENTTFTPHTGGVTYDTWARRGEFIFRNIQRVWAGEKPLAVVS
ncbi:MAG: lactate dehydrogenase [Betaproteobacteria bacterium]|nr:lactate dehydrogenase [Betaproteobacteria bacterium]